LDRTDFKVFERVDTSSLKTTHGDPNVYKVLKKPQSVFFKILAGTCPNHWRMVVPLIFLQPQRTQHIKNLPKLLTFSNFAKLKIITAGSGLLIATVLLYWVY
jgi:hypothetical protein